MAWIKNQAIPKVLSMFYLKRTQQENPRVLGPKVRKTSAKALESEGVAELMKKLLKPENEVRLTDITSDGDGAPLKLARELVWEEGDDVPEIFFGQKVCKNYQPKLHKGLTHHSVWSIRFPPNQHPVGQMILGICIQSRKFPNLMDKDIFHHRKLR